MRYEQTRLTGEELSVGLTPSGHGGQRYAKYTLACLPERRSST